MSINNMKDVNEKYTITKLLRQTKVKSAFNEVDKLELCLTGIVGEEESHSLDRQITLIGKPALDWISNEGKQSICGAKFKANLHIGTTLSDLKVGDKFGIIEGNIVKIPHLDSCNCENDMIFPVIEITGVGKKCYPDICKSFSKDNTCVLKNEIAFAKVISEGIIELRL